MLVTPSKRAAAHSPDPRPPKRHAPSSPEEGELDDATPPVSSLPPRPSGDAGPSSSPRAASQSAKVPFPFKKKPAHIDVRDDHSTNSGRPPPLSYNRPPEDDRRYRGGDGRRENNLRYSRYDERPSRGGDHWVASGYHDTRPARSWDERSYNDNRSYRSSTIFEMATSCFKLTTRSFLDL